MMKMVSGRFARFLADGEYSRTNDYNYRFVRAREKKKTSYDLTDRSSYTIRIPKMFDVYFSPVRLVYMCKIMFNF